MKMTADALFQFLQLRPWEHFPHRFPRFPLPCAYTQVLHDMQTVERHPIIKLVNEFKRREEEDYNN
jgi:hypothetical protein